MYVDLPGKVDAKISITYLAVAFLRESFFSSRERLYSFIYKMYQQKNYGETPRSTGVNKWFYSSHLANGKTQHWPA